MRLQLLACFLLISSSSFAQQVEVLSWETHSSMLNISDAVETQDGIIWAATTGGVFSYDPMTQQVEEFRNIEALLDVNTTAIAWNESSNELFVGTFSGNIEILRDGKWVHITDIAAKEAEFASVAIRDIEFIDSIALIGGDFGLAVFDTHRDVFLSTVTIFGDRTAPEVLEMLIDNNRLYVATSLGVVFAELNEEFWFNPRNPAVWSPLPIDGYSPFTRMHSMTIHDDELYVGGDTLVLRLDASDTLRYSRSWNQGIVSVLSIDNQLYYSSPSSVLSYSGHYFKRIPEIGRQINKLVKLTSIDASEPSMLSLTMGIVHIPKEPSDTTAITPATPIDNRFAGVASTPDGSIWTVSNRISGSGFSRLQNGQWTNQSSFINPEVLSNDCYTIDVTRDGSVWIGTWGRGTLKMSPSDNYSNLSYYKHDNSCMQGYQLGSDFTLGGPVADGFAGSSVLVNVDTDAFVVLNSDGSCEVMRPPFSIGELMYSLAVRDLSGTVFLGGPEGQGILYWNSRGTETTTDDVWGRITASTTILDENGQSAMIVDRDGALWIGASQKLYVLANPGSVLNNSSLFMREVSALQGQTIVDIAVDPQNNKWIATKEGVFVLDPDGIEIVNVYNVDNSRLVSEDILSIAFDDKTGRCIIGTNLGLSIAHTTSLAPNESFEHYRCYPQPFVPEQHDYMVIEGLAGEASVHIASVDGTIVKILDAGDSQKVVWDGTNQRGELVPTGVYYVGAGSETQGSSAVVKLAVVRK